MWWLVTDASGSEHTRGAHWRVVPGDPGAPYPEVPDDASRMAQGAGKERRKGGGSWWPALGLEGWGMCSKSQGSGCPEPGRGPGQKTSRGSKAGQARLHLLGDGELETDGAGDKFSDNEIQPHRGGNGPTVWSAPCAAFNCPSAPTSGPPQLSSRRSNTAPSKPSNCLVRPVPGCGREAGLDAGHVQASISQP